MKRPIKKVLALLLCLTLAASLAVLSGCSILLPALENLQETPAGPGGPSGDGPAGTYTLDVALFDEFWFDNVVDAALWRTTGTVGAYAKDTLVLNDDGTYALTKEMGADQASIDRWSSDGGVADRNFNTYTYYGTYTMADDGVTVTLSPCTKIAVEVDVFDMTVGYDLGSFPIDFTETDDLTTQAGTCHGELVVDFFVGPYIVATGHGNAEQVVTLGTYDYGTFTFTSPSGTVEPAPTDPPENPDADGYAFTPGTNPEITFTVYPDGTYTFAWPANSVSESGTWTYEGGKFTVIDPNGKETVADINGDKISFTYYFSQNDQLNQAYTGSVAALEAVIGGGGAPAGESYDFTPGTNPEITFTVYPDGTYTFAWPANSVSESGTWTYEGGKFTVIDPNGKETVADISGDEISFTYYFSQTDQLNQAYTGSVAALEAAIGGGSAPAGDSYDFTPGTNPEITFTVYPDGTYTFAWPANGVSESGTWTYEGGKFTVTDPNGKETVADISGDEISFTYYFSQTDQLNQAYTGSVAAMEAVIGGGGGGTASGADYDFTPGNNPEITFTVHPDGTYTFAWPANGVSESGTWTYEGGKFTVIDPNGKETVADINGDEISFTYYFSKTDQLNQAYTGSVAALEAAIQGGGAA